MKMNKPFSAIVIFFISVSFFFLNSNHAFGAGTCSRTGTCEVINMCSPDTPLCDLPSSTCGIQGTCVECTNADRSHCSATEQVCNAGQCVECTEGVTSGCPKGKNYCNASNRCVQCVRDGNGNSIGCGANQTCTDLNICENDTQTTCVSNTVSPCSSAKPCCDTDRFMCVRPNSNPNEAGTCQPRTDTPTPNCDCRQNHASDDCSGDGPVCVAGGGAVCNIANGMNGWCVNQTTVTNMCSCQNGFCAKSATGTFPCNDCGTFCKHPDPKDGPTGGLDKPSILPTGLDPSQFIGFLAGLMIPIAVLISIVRLLEGGYKFILSEGDEAKISEGKEIMTSAVIGLIMAIVGVSLLRMIINTFIK